MKNLAIVLPCYNESERFSVDEIMEEINIFPEVHFLFVNDGSTDKTGKILEDLCKRKENSEVLHLKTNVGKGEAVRRGMLKLLSHSQYLYIGYFDSDFATPLNQLTLFFDHIKNNKKSQFLFGSRIKRAGAYIDRNQWRHYSGRIIATIINNSIVNIPIYDTQCGAKILTSNLARELFKEPFISKWLFDVELIARLQTKYSHREVLEMVYEIPLMIWEEKGNSKIKFKDVLQIPSQLLKINNRYKSITNTDSNNLKV